MTYAQLITKLNEQEHPVYDQLGLNIITQFPVNYDTQLWTNEMGQNMGKELLWREVE